MSSIHEQLKTQRKALGLKQEDMVLRVGMARQQYQRLEAKGNPRLDTLELVAKGLKMELMLIPKEKLHAVRDLLEGKSSMALGVTLDAEGATSPQSLSDDPWQGLLEGDS
ncbi:MAG: helix-turn-helix domain-containing protein [Pseudomonadales bacterium]|nr:helix-turn-helix domain-containing protein [Pseudomonadales bacterium]